MVFPNFLHAGTIVALLLKAESANKYFPAEKKSLGANNNAQLLNTHVSTVIHVEKEYSIRTMQHAQQKQYSTLRGFLHSVLWGKSIPRRAHVVHYGKRSVRGFII
jgi:hypothetical protein